jgi:spore germination protein GerM
MKKILLLVLFMALLAFVAGVALVLKPFGDFTAGNQDDSATAPIGAAQSAEVQREVVLYFGTLGVPQLAQQMRYIPECATERECIMDLVQQLINGPDLSANAAVADLVPVLPVQALLLDAEVVDETVNLNFNKALISHHPGGSSTELLTVHALINTLAANLPHIRDMVLLVEGQPIATLRGHVDLRLPVAADFSLVRQESEAVAVEPLVQELDAAGIDNLESGQPDNPQSDQTGENIQ